MLDDYEKKKNCYLNILIENLNSQSHIDDFIQIKSDEAKKIIIKQFLISHSQKYMIIWRVIGAN